MLKQHLTQKLSLKLSPQQIQLMQLLQVPTFELEQRIKEEIEENPALEEGPDFQEDSMDDQGDSDSDSKGEDEFDLSDYLQDDDVPDYKYSASNYSADDEDREMPFSSGKSFHEFLTSQMGLRKTTEREALLAEHLIGNIDEAGYLRRAIPSIVDDLAFTQNIMTTEPELEDVLDIIHDFDPAGVGARDLSECLLIQLSRKQNESEDVDIAIEILEKCFDEFTKKHYSKIISKLNLTEEDLKAGLDEILKLNPKPGGAVTDSSNSIQTIIPDFTVTNEDNELTLSLNGRNAPELRVSGQYREMFQTYSDSKGRVDKSQKDAVQFVKQKLDAAKWFIDAVRQRQFTLLFTMEAIMEYQTEYFLSGDDTKLRPMILKDIADKIKMDISTVSRVVNSKYVQTPFGIFLLKSFFSESMQKEDGEEVSTKEIKSHLKNLIADEVKKKPLTDEKLAKLLKEKGYNIARRTVAKYREQLNIPVARLRKAL